MPDLLQLLNIDKRIGLSFGKAHIPSHSERSRNLISAVVKCCQCLDVPWLGPHGSSDDSKILPRVSFCLSRHAIGGQSGRHAVLPNNWVLATTWFVL